MAGYKVGRRLKADVKTRAKESLDDFARPRIVGAVGKESILALRHGRADDGES